MTNTNSDSTLNTYTNFYMSLDPLKQSNNCNCVLCQWGDKCSLEDKIEAESNGCDYFDNYDTNKLDIEDQYIGDLIESGRQDYRDEFEEYVSEFN
jgi:hypothetical protein